MMRVVLRICVRVYICVCVCSSQLNREWCMRAVAIVFCTCVQRHICFVKGHMCRGIHTCGIRQIAGDCTCVTVVCETF